MVTHSHLVFVVKAYWQGAVASSAFLAKGAVASSAFLATCFAIVPATRRRITSPTTIPLTPRLVSSKLSTFPISSRPTPLLDGPPCAKIDVAWDNNSESCSSPNTGWRWSAVLPEGPPAAPLLAVRKQMRNWDSSISKPTDGVDWITSSLNSWRGRGGLLPGFVNSLNVANVPGAICLSSAILHANNSQRWTRFLARSVLFSTPSRVNAFVRTHGGLARHWKDFSPTTATTGHSGTIGLVPQTSSWVLHLLMVVCEASSSARA